MEDHGHGGLVAMDGTVVLFRMAMDGHGDDNTWSSPEVRVSR
jgi:hypothetical protein